MLLLFAVLLVLHAAYSTYEYLSHLKAIGRASSQIPFNIVLESALGLLTGTLAASLACPELKEIAWSSEMRKRSVDEMDSRSGFADYKHRGHIFFGPSLGSS